MRKISRLNENDLTRLIRRILSEQPTNDTPFGFQENLKLDELNKYKEENELSGEFIKDDYDPNKFTYEFTDNDGALNTIEFTYDEFKYFQNFKKENEEKFDIIDKFQSMY